jgi:iron complex outermembrane receptor protein
VRAAQGYQVSIGEVRNKGVEFDAAGEILPGWKVIGSYSYIDSVNAKDTPGRLVYDPLGNVIGANGYQGFELPGISRHMGSLWTTYEFQNGDWKGLKIGGGSNYRSKSYGDLFDSFHVPSYATVGLMGSYSWMLNGYKLTAQLNVDNLLDTRYYSEANGGPTNVTVGTPRMFKGTLRMEF